MNDPSRRGWRDSATHTLFRAQHESGREAGAYFPKTTDRGGKTRGEMLSATLCRDGSLIVDVEPERSLLMDWHNEYQVGRK